MNTVFPMNRSQNICQICMEAHPLQNRCSYDALVRRVTKLAEANRLIPGVMQANKEATDLAETFRKMANDTSNAILIIEKSVMEFENGPQVWTRVQERLQEAWEAKKTSPQDTAEKQLELFENTTPSETESKPSTGETPSGGLIVPDSWR